MRIWTRRIGAGVFLSLLLAGARAGADGPAMIDFAHPQRRPRQAPMASAAARQQLVAAGMKLLPRGAAATAFSLADTHGAVHSLQQYRGRWTLLCFFATWCGPCAQEMPSLERLARASRGRLNVVAVAASTSQDLEGYGRRMGLSLPLLWDTEGEVVRAYRVVSYPRTYVIGPGGDVVATLIAARDWMDFMPVFARLPPR